MIGRRDLVTGIALGMVSARVLARPAPRILQRATARVIVDNDFAGDPDGLVALAHQLLSPKTRVALVTVSGLDPKLAGGATGTAAAGRDIALELIRRAGVAPVPVIAGVEDFSGAASPAARAIVAEALRNDPLPLFMTCGGPLTNVAAALRLAPEIARRMTIVWIGGGAYPAGGWEYNLATDLAAARHVIEESRIPLWQVPQGAYRQMQYSVAEMAAELRPISPFSRWLYDRFTTPPSFVEIGGAWPLGDTPLVLLTAISTESSAHRELPGRRIEADLRYGAILPGRMVTVFEQLDARLAFGDMIALLKLHGR